MRRFPAEGLDVEGAAAGQVEDPFAQLRRAGPGVGAADVHVALPSPGASGVPQDGHSVGMTKSRTGGSWASRSARTGPTISGITSPALRSTTMSPIFTPLALTTSWLCRVAISTVEPATLTGSITP